MASRIRYPKSIALPTLLAGLFLGCSASDGGGSGTLEMGITATGQALTADDAGPDGGTIDADAGTAGPRLLLNVRRIDVHVAGTDDSDPPDATPPTPNPPPPDDEGGWVTIFSGAVSLDLLQAGSVETFLASATVPAGKITQIRLVLADAVWVEDGRTQPVTCPSCTQTGLKIVTMGKVVVPQGGTLHVTLDFDRDHSVRAEKDGYRLDPVVKIARTSVR
jgi:hypothetical protein